MSFLNSSPFRWAVKLLLYDLSSFFLEALRTMCFPLSTALIVSHKFGYSVPSFSLSSKESWIFFFISSNLSLSRKLLSFHLYVGFLLIFLLLKTSLSPWWSDRIDGINSMLLYLLRFVCVWVYGQLIEGTMKNEKVYCFVLDKLFCTYLLNPFGS